jgi:hypothetical protein
MPPYHPFNQPIERLVSCEFGTTMVIVIIKKIVGKMFHNNFNARF